MTINQGTIRLLEQALREVPGYPRLLLELGRLIGQTGKKQAARAWVLEAFTAAPQDVCIISGYCTSYCTLTPERM